MKATGSKRRKLAVFAAVVVSMVAGLAAPLLFDFDGDEFQFENTGVVAAPRDSFAISRPIVLDTITGTHLTAGRLSIVLPKNKETLTGEQSAKLLEAGEAVLLLDSGELVVGATAPKVAPDAADRQAPLVRAIDAHRYKAMALRGTSLVLTLPDGRNERIARAEGRIVPGRNGALQASGRGYWRGQRVKFEFKADEIGANGQLPIEVSFSATLLDATFKGRVATGLSRTITGEASVRVHLVEKFANALGVAWPVGNSLKSVTVSGPLRWEKSTLTFDQTSVVVDRNKAEGTLSINSAADRANISGTLAFEQLDVDSYVRFPRESRPILASLWAGLSSVLQGRSQPHLDVDLRLSAKSLVIKEQSLGPAAATISMKKGRLSADVAEIVLPDDGRATGQVSLDFNRFLPKLSVRGKLDGVSSGPLLAALFGSPMLAGRARVVADLRASGTTLKQIVSDLTGRIELSLPETSVLSLSLVDLKHKEGGATRPSVDDTLARVLKGHTKLSQAEIFLSLANGKVASRGSRALFSGGQAHLFGSFDLVRRHFDLRMAMHPLAKAADQAKKADDAAQISEPPPILNGTLVHAKSGLEGQQVRIEPTTGTMTQIMRRVRAPAERNRFSPAVDADGL